MKHSNMSQMPHVTKPHEISKSSKDETAIQIWATIKAYNDSHIDAMTQKRKKIVRC